MCFVPLSSFLLLINTYTGLSTIRVACMWVSVCGYGHDVSDCVKLPSQTLVRHWPALTLFLSLSYSFIEAKSDF